MPGAREFFGDDATLDVFQRDLVAAMQTHVRVVGGAESDGLLSVADLCAAEQSADRVLAALDRFPLPAEHGLFDLALAAHNEIAAHATCTQRLPLAGGAVTSREFASGVCAVFVLVRAIAVTLQAQDAAPPGLVEDAALCEWDAGYYVRDWPGLLRAVTAGGAPEYAAMDDDWMTTNAPTFMDTADGAEIDFLDAAEWARAEQNE